jgi:hypothetical protein
MICKMPPVRLLMCPTKWKALAACTVVYCQHKQRNAWCVVGARVSLATQAGTFASSCRFSQQQDVLITTAHL